jgi:predicted DCC family thiol-disulfide oxidoreductase YuxK
MNENLIIYDGECGFCNKTMLFIARRDSDGKFRFISNSSEKGKKILLENGLTEISKTSVVLCYNKKILTKGKAIKCIFSNININPVLKKIIEYSNLKALNLIYSLISKNRLLLSKGYCEIPPKEILSKFIMT